MDEAWKRQALAKIEAVFRAQFLDESLKVTEATSPEDIEEWDSVAHVGLLAAMEAAFDVRFSAQDMAQIDSVAALLARLAALGAR